MMFQDQVVLVTGAGRGIGKATALHFAKLGASVAFTNRNVAYSKQTQSEVESLGAQCLPFQVDVSHAAGVEQMVQSVLEQFGKIDIVVNNAGMTSDNLFLRMKEEDWQRVLNVNLNGAFYVCKSVMKSMMKQRYGRIINLSSVVGFSGNPGQANYCTAKAGLIGFTKSLAQEVASRGITCNAVAPGFIETDMTANLANSQSKQVLEKVPMKRMGTVDEIASVVAFLASKDAGYITGTTIHVNGGMYC